MGSPLSTGFHDVICIVLRLYHLSYLFCYPPFPFIIAFNKAAMTFIILLDTSEWGNWSKNKKHANWKQQKHSIMVPYVVYYFLFGIVPFQGLDTSKNK